MVNWSSKLLKKKYEKQSPINNLDLKHYDV